MPIHFHFVYGCFPTIIAGFSNCDWDWMAQKAWNIYTIRPFTEKLANPWPKRWRPPADPYVSVGHAVRDIHTWLRWHRHLSRHQKQQKQHLNVHLDHALRCWDQVQNQRNTVRNNMAKRQAGRLCGLPLPFCLENHAPGEALEQFSFSVGEVLFCTCYYYYYYCCCIINEWSLLWAYPLR